MTAPSTGPRPRGDDLVAGIGWMVLATLLFIGMDAAAKHLAADYPVAQIVWARFFFHLVAMVPILGRRLPSIAVTLKPRLQILRGVMVMATNAAVVASLVYIPLAEAEALAMASPLFVALLSVPFLREPVSPRRAAGIVLGFAGVLVILRPGAGVMHWAAGLALLSALLYGVNQVIMRHLGGYDAPLTTVLLTAIIGSACASAIVPFVWVAPTLEGWAVMLAMGCLSLGGQYTLVRAFSTAPAAAISPFNYIALVWAALFGWLLFGDLPDAWTIAGAVIVMAGGLAVFRSR